MCIEWYRQPEQHIAEEPIKVYKLLRARSSNKLATLHGPHRYNMKFTYQPKRRHKQRLAHPVRNRWGCWESREGLYSTSSWWGLRLKYSIVKWYEQSTRTDDHDIVVEMYIPKGARYYKNRSHYVSEALVWKRKVVDKGSPWPVKAP